MTNEQAVMHCSGHRLTHDRLIGTPSNGVRD